MRGFIREIILANHLACTDNEAIFLNRIQKNKMTNLHIIIIIIIIISIRTKSTNTEKQLTQQYRL